MLSKSRATLHFLFILIIAALIACTPSQAVSEDPYGCQNASLTAAERANCGVHLYEVVDEITGGACTYDGVATRTREDGGGIAFSENGFRFVDVSGNYGKLHPLIAENTYSLKNEIGGTDPPRENVLEYRFEVSGFTASVDRYQDEGNGPELWCSSQSTYRLKD